MSGAKPRVSVVVPSFNQARFIREALDSILDQDYPSLEVLVMDGGSTDGTVEILREYGDRVSFVSGPDSGQADALNRGFAKAKGEIVAWLNSDDRYCPGAIEAGVAALEAEPDAGFVYGEGELIDENGRFLCRFPATQPFDLWVLTRVSDFIMQPTVFMRASALKEAGGLDPSLHFGLDWDLWIRMALGGEVAFCATVLAQSREYASTKTSSGGFQRWLELKRIVSRYGGTSVSPATIIYGLDSLRRKWPAVFGPRVASDEERLKGNLFRPIQRFVARSLERLEEYSQGISIDRWVGQSAYLAMPWRGGAAVLRVAGEVPAPPAHFPVTITVRVGNLSREVMVSEWGGFEIALRLPPDGKGPRPLEIRVEGSRVFRAAGDPRRLCFKIGEARIEEGRCVRVVRPFGEVSAT